ncbi:type 1 fimbrial protein [Pseudocitrobacter faecalis]|nr:type 1 fimbrial protein [Pseudocitrobacter faecalis]
MKKIYLGLMVTAALLGGNVAAYADDASAESFNSQGHGGDNDHGGYPGGGNGGYVTGGQVFFDGDVYTGSCKVKIVGGKNDGNTIFLNSVRTTALSVKNALVNRTDFSINLKDCGDPDGKHGTFTRKVKWTDSSGLVTGTSFLKNTDNSGATNVAFALTNPNSPTVIKPGNDNGKIRDTNDGTWDIYKYQVSYVNPTNSSATAGHVAANATYEISYD